jgi:two-component system, cell cycle sensor histidine kinase and response regulator CckA
MKDISPDFQKLPDSPVKTVLLADDEPAVRFVVEKILLAAGYQVIATENGVEAGNMAEKHTGGIDVLVSDIVMPGVSGVELAKSVQKSRPGTKVLLMSGYFPDGLEFLEGWEFLHKPFSPGALTKTLESLLNAA